MAVARRWRHLASYLINSIRAVFQFAKRSKNSGRWINETLFSWAFNATHGCIGLCCFFLLLLADAISDGHYSSQEITGSGDCWVAFAPVVGPYCETAASLMQRGSRFKLLSHRVPSHPYGGTMAAYVSGAGAVIRWGGQVAMRNLVFQG